MVATLPRTASLLVATVNVSAPISTVATCAPAASALTPVIRPTAAPVLSIRDIPALTLASLAVAPALGAGAAGGAAGVDDVEGC